MTYPHELLDTTDRLEALVEKWRTTPGAYVQHGSVQAAAWAEAVRQLETVISREEVTE